MRTVTSTRGRPSSASDMTSRPSTRPEWGCHTGRTPSRARASATSSPWVRMLAVPHTTRPTTRGRVARLGHVPLDQPVGQGPPDVPRQRRRDGLRVDGVEVAPGGENVGAAPGRGAAGPGRHVAAVQAGEKVVELVGRPDQGGDQASTATQREGRVARGRRRRPERRASTRRPALVLQPVDVAVPARRGRGQLGGHRRPQRRHRPLGLAGDGEDGVDQRLAARAAGRARAGRPGSGRP